MVSHVLYVDNMEVNNNKGVLWGYARVSTDDQNLSGQIKALDDFGVDQKHIYQEYASGATVQRRIMSNCLASIREGDTLVVYKLDRLGRTLTGIKEIMDYLNSVGANFKSLQDGIETQTATGRLIFHIFAALAEWERDVISERTKMGIAARQAMGVKFGPAHSIADNPKRLKEWETLYHSGSLSGMSAKQVLERLNVADPDAKPIGSVATYRYWRDGIKDKNGGWKREPLAGAVFQDDEPLDVEKVK